MPRFDAAQYAKSVTCPCGKLAKYKAMVSIYPLGVKKRFTRTATPIPVCETCMKPTPGRVNKKTVVALTSAFAEAVGRAITSMEELNSTSKR